MKRLLMGLLLVVTAGAASAEWTLEDFSVELIQYVDRASIRRNGNLVKMWGLSDFKRVQTVSGYSYLSEKTELEIDCKEVRLRMVAFTWFAEQMGNGKVVYANSDPRKWSPIQPGSVRETQWKIACGKK